MKYFVFALLLGGLLITGCKKEAPVCAVKATINYTGPVEVDGTDWVVRIDSTNYHPAHLDNAWRVENLPVKIAYHFTGNQFMCECVKPLPEIELDCIEEDK